MLAPVLASLLVLSFSGPGDVELRWEAPAGCPDREQMMARLMVPPGVVGLDPVQVSAVVQERDAGYWVLELELSTPSGSSHRRVDARDCRTLAETTAIVTAVYLGGLRGYEKMERPESEDPPLQRPRTAADVVEATPDVTKPPEEVMPAIEPTPDRDVRAPTVKRQRKPRSSRSNEVHGAIYLAGGVGGGILPQVDLTTTVGFGIFGRRWRAELAGARWFPRNEDAGGGVGVDVDMWSGRASAGPRFRWRKLSFPILTDVEVGAMHGRGVGSSLVRADDAWAPWVAAGLSGALAWGLHPNVALWARASGHVSLYRPLFLVRGVGSAFTAGVAGGRLCVGLELRLPGIREHI